MRPSQRRCHRGPARQIYPQPRASPSLLPAPAKQSRSRQSPTSRRDGSPPPFLVASTYLASHASHPVPPPRPPPLPGARPRSTGSTRTRDLSPVIGIVAVFVTSGAICRYRMFLVLWSPHRRLRSSPPCVLRMIPRPKRNMT
ncbi:MEF2-activating motif and SAP domain-containing transcriptional regulator-like isoform X4 [Triticum urartu]|uniref:MEF2-activating motif and SAP domain-containing transcriptional regulator-like isoform X4 n=1 Tax=Triticum urartu TaxID=4572 RepID=UPI0020438BE6|nr:MEF2-activating motif and SAP domain-containing transcriptional regulator-like isoform X4 [Triticum urartu]